jgi:hypothetical protein
MWGKCYSGINTGGSFQPEQVAAFDRNGWQASAGMGGRFEPDYAEFPVQDV